MESTELANKRLINGPSILLILSIVFSYYYIDLGFALKPYMILSIFFFIFSFKKIYINRFRVYEVTLFIFFLYFCLTGFFAKYPSYSLRMIIGVLLVLFCYLIMRYIFSLSSINNIEKSILIGGIIYNGLSLVLYLVGLISLGFVTEGNQIDAYGVTIDRNLPRLTGLTEDPNVFVFFNLVFFFYYLTHLKIKWAKVGLILSTISILLTLSRGGILAVIFGLIIMFFSANIRQKIYMTIFIPISIIILNYISKITLKLDLINTAIERFSTSDSGSGRADLWLHGLQFFYDNPIFGIGIFNFLPYSVTEFGLPVYMHSAFIDSLVEGGIIGFFLYILVFIIFIITYYVNREKITDKGYILFAFVGMIVMMNTYSLMINEAFYLLLALMWRYLYEVRVSGKNIRPIINNYPYAI